MRFTYFFCVVKFITAKFLIAKEVNEKYKLVEGQNKLKEAPFLEIKLSLEITIHHHD
tara:strand:+ start:299 stop:469 length:171 start_codon:yes stop_codon:yes gene_type:complete